MPGESKQQELAKAIGKVIIPMVETGDGIDDGPLQEFLHDEAENILSALNVLYCDGKLKPKKI